MKRRAVLFSLAALLSACSNDASFVVPQQAATFSSTLYNNKVDIVWVVDDSTSMSMQQQKLSDEIPALVSTLNSLKLDYRMVVTTTSVVKGYDGGTYIGSPKVLTSATPNLVDVLKTRILRGEMGVQKEEGINSLQKLLSDSYINGDGAGFHREESLLLINVLSDEDDQTDGTRESVVQALVSRLNTLKRPYRPNVGGWLVNFIGVIDTQCYDSFGKSWIGYRYMDLAQASGGKKYSICSGSLKSAVDGLRARVLEILTDYQLAQVPKLDTVKVYKNEVLVPRSSTNGWDYIPSSNVIRFYGSAVPAADSSIRVEFTPDSAS